MGKALAFLSAAAAFLMAAQAVRDQASFVRAGYELAELERTRDQVVEDVARARERVGRLRSPGHLAERARDLGLATEYGDDFEVVRLGPELRAAPRAVLAKGR